MVFDKLSVPIPEIRITNRNLKRDLTRPAVRAFATMYCRIGTDDRQGKRKQIPGTRDRNKLGALDQLKQMPSSTNIT